MKLAVGLLSATVPAIPTQPRHCHASTRRTLAAPVQTAALRWSYYLESDTKK